jgi:hypothetical protein
VTAPSKRVVGGEKVRVRATGLLANEKYRVRVDGEKVGHGTASAAGNAKVRVKIPGSTEQGRHKVVVRGVVSESTGAERIRVLAKKAELRLSYEPVGTVQATANGNGVYALTTKAGWGWGARTATATGAGEKRIGTTRVIVGPRVNQGTPRDRRCRIPGFAAPARSAHRAATTDRRVVSVWSSSSVSRWSAFSARMRRSPPEV